MNILFVDDQTYVLSSIMTGVNWRAEGFASVFTATSAAAAKELFQKHPIDILVTDIEMPGEDGLSLLTWVREQGYDTACILLTSHADFFYAQQAIGLGVIDYVVQPATSEDILRAVNRAKNKLSTKDMNRPAEVESAFTIAAKNMNLKSCFENWPSSEIIASFPHLLTERLEELNQFHFYSTPEDHLTVCYLHILNWRTLPLAPPDFIQKLQGITEQQIPDPTIIYFTNENCFFMIICADADTDMEKKLTAIRETAASKIRCSFRLFFAEATFQTVRDTMTALTRFDVLRDNDVNVNIAYPYRLPEDQVAELSHTTSEPTEDQMTEIRDYIVRNLSEPITRTQIADALFLSPAQISAVIKKYQDMGCKEYITQLKMNYARELLRAGKTRISNVASLCGYDSFSYFSKVYKDTFGITPREEKKGQE